MRGAVSMLTVRPFRDHDEPEVLDLLTASLGGGPAGHRSSEFFRWKHLQNPFGRSILLIGEIDGRIVGLRAFMRWRFAAGDRMLDAVRAVDTATHPEFQGRGIFSELTRAALDEARRSADLVFNTPNAKSLPGYLKMGWSTVGRVPILVRVRRPTRLPRLLSRSPQMHPRGPVGADPATDVLADHEMVAGLLRRIEDPGARLATPRTIDYLRWRYGSSSLLDYRAIPLEDEGGLGGLAIFRVRARGGSWETTIAELLVPTGRVSAATQLLRQVLRAARSDHLACSFPVESAARRASRRAGYVRIPGGMTLVTNPLGGTSGDALTRLRFWALSLGDLEVF